MKKLLVLGAGTAGTMVVNKLRADLPVSEWDITIVDQSDTHYYQPGYLFLPFGDYTPGRDPQTHRTGSSPTASPGTRGDRPGGRRRRTAVLLPMARRWTTTTW